VLLVVFGYRYVDERREQTLRRHALVTARVWVARARYRDDPEGFAAYRDSLLDANGLTSAQIRDYLARAEEQPEQSEDFVSLVSEYVDSLSSTEANPPDTAVADTAAMADSSLSME
jgi:hypothetical protein